MRRFLVFLLLGPLIGSFVFGWAISPMGDFLAGRDLPEIPVLIAMPIVAVPFGYLLGIVPSVVTGFVDWMVSRFRWGIVVTVLFGLVASIAFIPPAKVADSYPWWPLYTGLVGAIPAGLCSWLSRKKKPVPPGKPASLAP